MGAYSAALERRTALSRVLSESAAATGLGMVTQTVEASPPNTHPPTDAQGDVQDMGVGVSHYFELLRTLALLMLGLFVLGLPSLVITFVANPDAASDAVAAAGPLGVLKSPPPPPGALVARTCSIRAVGGAAQAARLPASVCVPEHVRARMAGVSW